MKTSVDDGWPYATMQNTDIDLAPLVNSPICPVKAIFHYAILLCDHLASLSQAGQRNGIWPATRTRRAHQVFAQLLAAREPARELIADLLASWSQAG